MISYFTGRIDVKLSCSGLHQIIIFDTIMYDILNCIGWVLTILASIQLNTNKYIIHYYFELYQTKSELYYTIIIANNLYLELLFPRPIAKKLAIVYLLLHLFLSLSRTDDINIKYIEKDKSNKHIEIHLLLFLITCG